MRISYTVDLINHLQGLENRMHEYIMIQIHIYHYCKINSFNLWVIFKFNLTVNGIICLLPNFYFWKNTLKVSFANYSLLISYRSFQSLFLYLKDYFYILPVHFIKIWYSSILTMDESLYLSPRTTNRHKKCFLILKKLEVIFSS